MKTKQNGAFELPFNDKLYDELILSIFFFLIITISIYRAKIVDVGRVNVV